jgi:hypothetical protein
VWYQVHVLSTQKFSWLAQAAGLRCIAIFIDKLIIGKGQAKQPGGASHLLMGWQLSPAVSN